MIGSSTHELSASHRIASRRSLMHLPCSRRQQRFAQPCRAYQEVLYQLAGNPFMVQDVLVGGTVIGAIVATLWVGLQKEDVVCDLCCGLGGAKCFGCDGVGKMPELISRDDVFERQPPKRDVLGRSSNPRQCRVCKGNGLIACSKCKGSGYCRG